MSVVGFDVGYLSSTIAAAKGGGIEVLLNGYSQRQTSSTVSFTEKQRELGEGARQKAITNFKNTVGFFKHFVGRDFNDPQVQALLARGHVKAEATENGEVGFKVRAGGEEIVVSAVQVFAMLLTHLRDIAKKELQSAKVQDAVVGVPCYFNDRQRHSIRAACQVAGINCISLMNETAAVALAYGIYRSPQLPVEGEKPRRVIFVDVGHSQIQMSVCDMIKGQLTVQATAFEVLGGRDFDRVLFDHFADEFKEKYKIDVRSNPRASIRLENECEKLKKLMSSNEKNQIPLNIECLMEDKDVTGKMISADFEALAEPLLTRVKDCCSRLIKTMEASAKDKKFNLADVDFVETVGGASRIPAIRRIIKDAFQKEELSATLNMDEAVSRGCALWACMKSPTFRVRDFGVHDKTQYAITLEWKSITEEEDPNAQVYTENAGSHLSKLLTFYRENDFDLDAVYTDTTAVVGNQSKIGTFTIKGVKPGIDGKAQKLKVKIKLDDHGCFVIPEAHMIEKLPVTEEEAPAPAPDAAATDAPAAEAAPAAKGDADGDAEMPAADSTAEGSETEAKSDEKKDAPAEEKKDVQPKKKQKTTKQTALEIVMSKPNVLAPDAVQKLLEIELQMQASDLKEKEKSDAKNSLEEYIYGIRDKVQGGELAEFIKEADCEVYCKRLTELEDWLYEDGEDEEKSVYDEKLKELTNVGDAVALRAAEGKSRPDAIEAFQKSLVRCRKFVDQKNGGEEKYAHISEEQVKKAADALAAKEQWLSGKVAELSGLEKWQDPVVLTSDIVREHSSFDAVYIPIMDTPVPKAEPPPAETAEGDAKPAEGEAKAADGTADANAKDGDAASAEPAKGDQMDLD